MPLPTTYNYSPQLQPAAWWQQAQQQIPGLPGLPTDMSATALASSYDSYDPHRGALQKLYSESLANHGAGMQTTGDVSTAIPGEVGGSALAELLSSLVGTSRSSVTPLAGLPANIGDTSYNYEGYTQPSASTGPASTGGWLIPGTEPQAPMPTGGDTNLSNNPSPAGSPAPAPAPAPAPGEPAPGGGSSTTYATPGSHPTTVKPPSEGQQMIDANGQLYLYQGGQWIPVNV